MHLLPWVFFQFKGEKIIGDINRVKTYMNDILVLGNYDLKKNTEKPRVIPTKIQNKGIKVNKNKCSLGLKYINYLLYHQQRCYYTLS